MKTFLNKIWLFLKVLFLNPEKWINENVLPSIQIVNNLKIFIDSPLAIAINAIIPGQWDDALRVAFSAHLHAVLDLFLIPNDGNEILEAQEPLEEKLKRFSTWLQSQTKTVKAAVYAKLCAKLAHANAGNDGTIKNNSIDLLTQIAYSKLKSNINENDLVDEVSFKRCYE